MWRQRIIDSVSAVFDDDDSFAEAVEALVPNVVATSSAAVNEGEPMVMETSPEAAMNGLHASDRDDMDVEDDQQSDTSINKGCQTESPDPRGEDEDFCWSDRSFEEVVGRIPNAQLANVQANIQPNVQANPPLSESIARWLGSALDDTVVLTPPDQLHFNHDPNLTFNTQDYRPHTPPFQWTSTPIDPYATNADGREFFWISPIEAVASQELPPPPNEIDDSLEAIMTEDEWRDFIRATIDKNFANSDESGRFDDSFELDVAQIPNNALIGVPEVVEANPVIQPQQSVCANK